MHKTRKGQACALCHQRKVRCDASNVGLPCTNCRSASRDDCRIHQKRKRAPRSAGPGRLDQSSPIKTEYNSAVSPAHPGPSNVSTAESACVPQDLASSPNSPPATAAYSSPSVHSSIVSAGVAGVDVQAAQDGEYVYKRHLVEFIDQPELADRPIDHKARMTYIGSDTSNINFLVSHQSGARVKVDGVCHYPTDRIARRLTCHDAAERLPLEAFQLPPKAVVDELLAAYFRYVNPGFPVIDERIFMAQYRARDSSDPPSLLLLHAILVVGAHALHHDDSEKYSSSKAIFFRRAKSLFDARFERNRDTMVQAALLLTWHTDGLDDVAANAWYWIGVAARTATGLGMHQDADGSTLVLHNKRMWRRVWWLLFQCDVWISLQYGRPQALHLDDSSVQRLKRSDFEDCGDGAQPEYLIEMTELSIVVSEALRARNQTSSPDHRQTCLQQTDEKLANWSLRLPQGLHSHSSPCSNPWSANLHLHYNMALIVLHRSQPATPADDCSQPKASDHGEICTASASAIQSIFQSLCDSVGLRYLWVSSINCLFTALIQLSLEIRLANPLLAISALRRYDSALISLERLSAYWPNGQSILHFFKSSLRFSEPRGLENGTPRDRATAKMQRDSQSCHGSVAPNYHAPMASLHKPEEAAAEQTSPLEAGMGNSPELAHTSAWTSSAIRENTGTGGVQQGDIMEPNMAADAMLDVWKQWQHDHWHTPEFSDDILFTF